MILGTTPTHIFNVPIDTSTISDLRIVYGQNDEAILTKKLEDCTLEPKAIRVRLSQEDTYKFQVKRKYITNHIQVQLRILTTSGDVISSKVMPISIEKCLDNEVLQ